MESVVCQVQKVFDVPTMSWVAQQQGVLEAGIVNLGSAVNQGTGGAQAWLVTQSQPTSAALANFTGSGASQTIAAANAARRGLTIFNDSGVVAYVKFGSAASATSFTVKMVDQAYYEVPGPIYTGIVTAFWASGSIRVTELT